MKSVRFDISLTNPERRELQTTLASIERQYRLVGHDRNADILKRILVRLKASQKRLKLESK